MASGDKVMTLRLVPRQAELVDAIARAEGKPVAQVVREAITARIEQLRGDEDFQ